MPEKNEKQLETGVRGISPVGGKAEELRRKRFVEKISFEPAGVEVGRSNGWDGDSGDKENDELT